MDCVVAFRAKSACRFPPDKFLKIRIKQNESEVPLIFRTRQVDKGVNELIPGDLWIDARGTANSVESAVSQFGQSVENITNVISFGTNAAIQDVKFHLAFDNTDGEKEREFIQHLIPDETIEIENGRNVNIELMQKLIKGIDANPDLERITRAISQYRLALSYWRFGLEALSLAHLYMGVEAITKAVFRKNKGDFNEEQFAASLGIKNKNRKFRSAQIESEVRKAIIFGGDNETYKRAKAASDGFEHGFMQFEEIVNHSRKVRVDTAKYLRTAIIDLLNIDEISKENLISHPFDVPIGCFPAESSIRGILNGESHNPQKGDFSYPRVDFNLTINRIEYKEENYHVSYNIKISPDIPEGMSFKLKSQEISIP